MKPMSGNSRSFDVAIVGGGPAGAICALLLARGGARVTMIDRGGKRFGVTELVSGRARRMIEERVSGSILQTIQGVEVFETVSLWNTPDAVTWSAMCNPWGAGLALDRSAFDETLRKFARESGVDILWDTEVQGVERARGAWRLALHSHEEAGELLAKFLIIATGRTGARLVGRNSITASPQVALMAQTNTGQSEPGYTLYVEAVANGWWYALPDPRGGWFVGFCTGRDRVKRRGEPLRVFWNRELRRTRLLAQTLGDTTVDGPIVGRPAGIRSFDKVTGESWIAVGDAAFAPDPLSGKGLEFGIESAALGARLLLKEAQNGDLTDYENWICEYAKQHERSRAFYVTTS